MLNGYEELRRILGLRVGTFETLVSKARLDGDHATAVAYGAWVDATRMALEDVERALGPAVEAEPEDACEVAGCGLAAEAFGRCEFHQSCDFCGGPLSLCGGCRVAVA